MTVFLQCFVIIRTEIGNGKKDQRRVETSARIALLLSSLSSVSGKRQAVPHAELSHHLRLKAIADIFAGLWPHLGLNMFVQARSLQSTSKHLVSLIHGLSHLKTVKSSWIGKQNMRTHMHLKTACLKNKTLNASSHLLNSHALKSLRFCSSLLLVRLHDYLGRTLNHSFPGWWPEASAEQYPSTLQQPSVEAVLSCSWQAFKIK